MIQKIFEKMKSFFGNQEQCQDRPAPSVPQKKKTLKLKEILKQIEDGDFTPETRDALYLALRRSGDDFLRSQHCRILAYSVFEKHGKKGLSYASDLIDRCFECFPGISGYEKGELWQYKGNFFYAAGDVSEAENCFRNSEAAFSAHWREIGKEQQSHPDADYHLLKTLLLRDRFRYSEELEQVLAKVLKMPPLGTRNVRVTLSCAIAVVEKEHGRTSAWENAIREAHGAIHENAPTAMEIRFKANRLEDPLNVPREMIDFVERQSR